MPVLYPVAAHLHDREKVERIIDTYVGKLQVACVSEVPPEGVVLILLCTGGTEDLVMEAARINPDIILLAHKGQNSLPAALEVLAWMKRMGISSRIIFGLDDASISEIETVSRVYETAETLKNSRIGIFGFPSPWLISIPNFFRAEKRFGVKFVHMDLSFVLREMSRITVNRENLDLERVECTRKDIEKALTLYHALSNIIEREKLQAVGVKCFDLIKLITTTGCLAVSFLNDAGVAAGCEADIPATFTMYVMQLLTKKPTFMGNPCSVSEDEILMAHCTISTQLVKTYKLRSHYESGVGVSIEGTLPETPVTLAQVDAEFQKMVLAEGEILESGMDFPELCRTQIRIKLGNSQELLKKSVGNHLVLSPGKHKEILKEFCNHYELEVVEI
jgi:L-fucose isomerase-like protein